MAVWNSAFAVAIMGNVPDEEYELVVLDTRAVTPDEIEYYTRRKFAFLGVIAIALHEGRPRVALDHDFDAETHSALSRTFLNLLERELNARVTEQVAKQVGDALEWLKRLQALPDIRNGMEN